MNSLRKKIRNTFHSAHNNVFLLSSLEDSDEGSCSLLLCWEDVFTAASAMPESVPQPSSAWGLSTSPCHQCLWRIMTATSALVSSPRMEIIRLFILDWQEAIRLVLKKKKNRRGKTKYKFLMQTWTERRQMPSWPGITLVMRDEGGHWARQLLSTKELGLGPAPAPRPCWGFGLLVKTACKVHLHGGSCSTAQKLVWEQRECGLWQGDSSILSDSCHITWPRYR